LYVAHCAATTRQGKGRIEGNEICANQRAGVAILKEGAPLVSRNKIFNGCARGRRSPAPSPGRASHEPPVSG
jgi:hypothetical protein